MTETTVVILILVGALIVFLASAIKMISPNEKGVVERLGKLHGIKDSGLAVIIPFIDTLQKVDMRERTVDVPPQEVICKDNVVVTVDAVIYIQVMDPVRALYNIQNFGYAVVNLAQTNLRAVIGQMALDETLSARENINTQLRTEIDENTDAWGVQVKRVEVKRIDPPNDVVDSMHKQMRAEREKRAAILEAEGAKQSAILNAQGERESQILKAEGEKQAAILNAEGVAKSIEIESVAAITYFKEGAITKEQLRVMEESMKENTKYVVGSEMMEIAKGIFNKFAK